MADPPSASVDLAEGRTDVVERERTRDEEVSHGAPPCSSRPWPRAGGRGAAPPAGAAASVGADRVGGKYFPIRRSSRRRAESGNAAGDVITAFRRSPGQAQVRGPWSRGMTRLSTLLAVATFFMRFATTASTVTSASVSCQTS